MAFVYGVTCGRCSYGSELVWPLWACYRLPSGHTPEVAQRVCWCGGCGSVTVAESATELERIDRLRALPVIAGAYDGGRKAWSADEKEAALAYARYPRFANLYDHLARSKRWGGGQSVVMKNTLELHREWRLARTSSPPPRCLECGGAGFVALAAGEEGGEPGADAQHPGCGGALAFVKARKALRLRRRLWTPEGQHIGVG